MSRALVLAIVCVLSPAGRALAIYDNIPGKTGLQVMRTIYQPDRGAVSLPGHTIAVEVPGQAVLLQ